MYDPTGQLRRASARYLNRLHRERCLEMGDHPDEVDTAYSAGADALHSMVSQDLKVKPDLTVEDVKDKLTQRISMLRSSGSIAVAEELESVLMWMDADTPIIGEDDEN